MLYAPIPGSNCSMNHSRCCASESGIAAPASRLSALARTAAPIPCRDRISSHRPATVGFPKIVRNGTSTPRLVRTRDTTCVASSEWPPNSKKLSSMPTRSTPSSSIQIAHNTSSISSRGPTYSVPSPTSGLGNARRSTFPCPVNGSCSRFTNADGTMYSGTLPLRYARNCWPLNSASLLTT